MDDINERRWCFGIYFNSFTSNKENELIAKQLKEKLAQIPRDQKRNVVTAVSYLYDSEENEQFITNLLERTIYIDSEGYLEFRQRVKPNPLFRMICGIDLPNLKQLLIEDSGIVSIEQLQRVNLESLDTINLRSSELTCVKSFSKVNCKMLTCAEISIFSIMQIIGIIITNDKISRNCLPSKHVK